MIGMFFNNFLPSTVGGDVVKVYYLSRFTGKGAAAFASVVIDRLIGMGGMCVVAIVSLLFGAGRLTAAIGREKAVIIFLIVGGVSAGLVLFFLIVFSARMMRGLFALIPWAAFREKIARVHDAVCVYRGRGATLLAALLISTGIWVVIVVDCWLIAQAFRAKIPSIPIGYFFLFLPTISVIMSLPISFSGLGTREAFFILFFAALKNPPVTEMDAVMLSLNFYFVSLAASLLGGVIYILKDQLRFHRGEIAALEK
jgi:hypothetical protein